MDMTASPPIVTLTLNPALDVSSAVDVVAPTHKLRCDEPQEESGGGGINVSRVCKRLGEPTIAVAPLGGGIGHQVGSLLSAEGIATRCIEIEENTRQSITILENSTGDQYRFVFPGPVLTKDDLARCCEAVVEVAEGSRCLVISGSVPSGSDDALTAELVERLPNTAVVVDTSGEALAAALQSGAHLVKPSARELSRVVNAELRTEAEVEAAARDLLGRSRVDGLVVSIGAGGAIAVPATGPSIRLRAPTVQVRSAVGAGDSMVAGLAVGVHRGWDLRESAKLGVAAGTATVLSDGTMLCDPVDVDALLPLVVIDGRGI